MNKSSQFQNASSSHGRPTAMPIISRTTKLNIRYPTIAKLNANSDTFMTFLRSLLTSSSVHTPCFLKYEISPIITKMPARTETAGLNHQYPSLPQYSVSDRAAAVETDARPNMTIITDGRQHNEATIADEEIHFQSPLSMQNPNLSH